MSNASQAAFRSHLMQQFVAHARSQARMPPISLLGWIDENQPQESDISIVGKDVVEGAQSDHGHADRFFFNPSGGSRNAHPVTISGAGTSAAQKSSSLNDVYTHQGSSLINASVRSNRTNSDCQKIGPFQLRSHSLAPAANLQNDVECSEENHIEEDISSLSLAFQDLIRTRRTAGRFHPAPARAGSLSTPSSMGTMLMDKSLLDEKFRSYWADALERAVIAGCSAPNHKKTEPFTFKRIIGPSSSHNELCDIIYHVSLLKLQQQQQHLKNVMTFDEIQLKAQHKRDRWSQIPAYLVTLVNSSKSIKNTSGTNVDTVLDLIDNDNEYDVYSPLPYRPPMTETELEDYAASCAAVQNCLLSLHSENLATKWATGSIIKTRAFRQLIHAQPDDRVVALIMIGGKDCEPISANPDSVVSSKINHKKKTHSPRRLRRQLHGDIMIDI